MSTALWIGIGVGVTAVALFALSLCKAAAYADQFIELTPERRRMLLIEERRSIAFQRDTA